MDQDRSRATALYDAAVPALRIIARDPAPARARGCAAHRARRGPHARVRAARDEGERARARAGEVAALGYEMVLGNTFHLFLRPGRRADRAARRAAPLHGLAAARSSPTRAASRCSRWGTGRSPTRSRAAAAVAARGSDPRDRGGGRALPLLRRRRASASSARRPRWQVQARWAPTSCSRSTSARRSTSSATTPRARPSARTAGWMRCIAWRAEHGPRAVARSTGSCRAASTRTCARVGAGDRRERRRRRRDRRLARRARRRRCTRSSAGARASSSGRAASAPRHLLGIGEIDDLIRGVELGIDTLRLRDADAARRATASRSSATPRAAGGSRSTAPLARGRASR